MLLWRGFRQPLAHIQQVAAVAFWRVPSIGSDARNLIHIPLIPLHHPQLELIGRRRLADFRVVQLIAHPQNLFDLLRQPHLTHNFTGQRGVVV
jgi:hypothetical protein